MENIDLNKLIQQIKQLSPLEQQLLIQSVKSGNDEPLTDKEKQFIADSEKHLKNLKDTNKKIDKVLSKFD